jgi:ubiquinone/menaquinone biosynthesis C-methylase UbiE|tara:strand:+ start:624 stop:1547 length:924 start_codon:yes stop_codon:yes gene_type:complete
MDNFSEKKFKLFVFEYYDFGKKLAKKALKSNIKTMGIQKAYSKVFNPVTDWSRFSEFFITSEILKKNLHDGDKVLDIGSPKLFSIWLSKIKKIKIICTDIWKPAVLEYKNFWGEMESNNESTITFEKADLLNLKYKDNEFDVVFSISTIEHAYDKDWKKTIPKNIGRVLKNNKIAIITTPYGSKSINQYKDHAEYSIKNSNEQNNFFMRIINKQDIDEFIKNAEECGLYLEETYSLNISASRLSVIIRRLPVHLNVLIGFLKPKLAINNFKIKKGIHIADNEKYEKKWSSDMITSDIVLVLRKRKIS